MCKTPLGKKHKNLRHQPNQNKSALPGWHNIFIKQNIRSRTNVSFSTTSLADSFLHFDLLRTIEAIHTHTRSLADIAVGKRSARANKPLERSP